MNSKQIVNVDKVKQINSAAVYKMIDQQGPISRIKIAEYTQLAPASVTKITRQLLATGLITEVAQQASTGGRRAISLMTEQQKFHFISVRLSRKKMVISLYEISGALLFSEALALNEQNVRAVLQKIKQQISQFIAEHVTKQHTLIAISLTLSGLVNPGEGIVVYTPHYPLREYPLASELAAHFELPCFIGNDTRAQALAEHYFGASKDCLDSVLVTVRSGAGAGIIYNGEVFLSQNRDVGEIGHIQIDPLGSKCQCGNTGCLETIVSNDAIIAQVKKIRKQGVHSCLEDEQFSVVDVCTAAMQGDTVCQQVLNNVAQVLGRAIAIAINFFHPEKILLSGDIMAADKLILPIIEQCVSHQALSSFSKDLPIEAAHFQKHPTIGGLALVKRALLDGSLLIVLINQYNQKKW